MNAYISDRIARDHADQLMADAALARRVRSARNARRAAGRSAKDAARAHPASPARVAFTSVFTRPVAAVHAWLAAGLL